jgi:hypothetical protein
MAVLDFEAAALGRLTLAKGAPYVSSLHCAHKGAETLAQSARGKRSN